METCNIKQVRKGPKQYGKDAKRKAREAANEILNKAEQVYKRGDVAVIIAVKVYARKDAREIASGGGYSMLGNLPEGFAIAKAREFALTVFEATSRSIRAIEASGRGER